MNKRAALSRGELVSRTLTALLTAMTAMLILPLLSGPAFAASETNGEHTTSNIRVTAVKTDIQADFVSNENSYASLTKNLSYEPDEESYDDVVTQLPQAALVDRNGTFLFPYRDSWMRFYVSYGENTIVSLTPPDTYTQFYTEPYAVYFDGRSWTGVTIPAEFYHLDGSRAFSSSYDRALPFIGEYTFVANNDGAWLIDTAGKIVYTFPEKYYDGDVRRTSNFDYQAEYIASAHTGSYRDGLIWCYEYRSDDSSYDLYYMDAEGNRVLEISSDEYSVFDFNQGYAQVILNETSKTGFIDKTGELVIPCVYDGEFIPYGDVEDGGYYPGGTFSPDGLVCVELGWKSGYINAKNEIIIPFEYDGATGAGDGKSGLVGVAIDGKYGLVDYQNRVALPFEYDSLTNVCDGVAYGLKDGLLYIITVENENKNAAEPTHPTAFTDVPENAYYLDAVQWAVSSGVTTGTSKTTFAPLSSCTRGQAVTFLWRANGSPEPGAVSNPFVDVSASSPFYKAILWACENGITTGTSDTTFSPDNACTRAHVVTFLWRAMGKPAAVETSALANSFPNSYYTGAVAWADGLGLLSGTDEPFTPNAFCPRADIITYLYRARDIQPVPRTDIPAPQSTVQRPPASDGIAYTTDKLLRIADAGMPGTVSIGGEYWYPIELLTAYDYFPSTGSPIGRVDYGWTSDGNSNDVDVWTFSLNPSGWKNYPDSPVMLDTAAVSVPSGVEIGKTELSNALIRITGTAADGKKLQSTTVENAIRTLDGKYPMVRLSALAEFTGMRETEQSIILFPDILGSTEIIWEEDLTGNVVKSLLKNSPNDTTKAIHDYLVNTLTHIEGMHYAYFDRTDPDRYERESQAEEQYQFLNNRTLTWRYGECEDYSRLFRDMCIQSGIPCVQIGGSADGSSGTESHAWNQIWLDGKWQYVDVTWDDPVGDAPTLRYNYYLITADQLMKDHLWYGDDYNMPEDYDPAWEQIDPGKISSADEFRKCLAAQMMLGKKSFSLRTVKSGAYGGGMVINFIVDHYQIPYFPSIWNYRYNSSTGTYDFTFYADSDALPEDAPLWAYWG